MLTKSPSATAAPDPYRTMLDGLACGVLLVDAESRVLAGNQQAEQILGFDADRVCGGGEVPWRFMDEHGEAVPPHDLPCQRSLRSGMEQRDIVLGVARADTSFAWVEFTARPTAVDGAPAAVLSFTDVTARRDAETRARGLADHDTLTGTASRRFFEDRLRAQVTRCRTRGESAVLILVDLDGLKAINGALGREAGDRHLKEAAVRLRAGLRDADLLARCGGDEFGILLGDVDAQHGIEVAQRLAASLKEPRALDVPAPVAGIGVCALDTGRPSAESALAAADAALAEAKAAGPGNVAVASAPVRGRYRPQRKAALVFEQLAGPTGGVSVDAIVAAARDLLEIDLAYLTRITPAEQVIEVLAGDGTSFGMDETTRVPIEETYCRRVLDGKLPDLMPDVSAVPDAAALPVTDEIGLGAYVSVPVTYPDGELHGTLCAAAHEARPDLSDRDRRYLHLLARLIGDSLERDRLVAEREGLRAASSGIRALAAAVEARDQYTSEHSALVLELVGSVARRLCLDEAAIGIAEQVALLHDLGKLAIPDAILHKDGPLDAEEWEIMRGHPDAGARLVAAVPELAHLADAIRAEHERWDGAGYPLGLAGEEIPIVSRIVFVCDAYHAMTSDRPYRGALPRDEALLEIAANAGTQFCPGAAAALIAELS